MRVTATEAKNRFGSLCAQAKREPVFVEKAGQIDTVILSAEQYLCPALHPTRRPHHRHLEPRPGVADAQLAAVRLRHLATQVQAQAHATGAARARGVRPVEGLAQARELVEGHAGAVVAQAERPASVGQGAQKELRRL